MQKSWALVAACVVLAVIFGAVAVFYLTTETSFLASTTAKHTKHAILFIALALLSLVAASFARPRSIDA
jgi:uncharacterized membrane protein YgdD (TMEM256/DUF423 family)